jgi:hypothetical protein
MTQKYVADTATTRRAKGWTNPGGAGVDATTERTSTTGTPMVAGADSTARDEREARWTTRDGFTSQGTAGRTASGAIHKDRS